MKHSITTYIAIVMSLVACSTDDGETQQQGQQTVALAAPVEEWRCGTTATRAPSFNDFNQNSPVTAENPKTIGVWGYNDTDWMKNPAPMRNVEFTYEATGDKLYHKGTWNQSTNKPENGAYPWGDGGTFFFYAVAPYTANAAAFDKETKTLTMTIPALSATDYMVAKQIKNHYTKTDGAIVKFTLTDYTFKHITACIQLAFALDSRYARNRYLDIKSVKAAVGGGVGQATYTYNPNDKTESWSATTTDATMLPLTDADSHWYIGDNPNMHVSDKYHAFTHFYVKEQLCTDAPITLEVTYDVYDLNGQMTRKDVTTTSTVRLGNYVITTNSEGKKCLKAGYYYNVLIYIIPDYLYVLSDNDNGSDTMLKIETK